eukprot:TRINITY_DN52105_c0_g1_i1.p2 TRINITY_DN52105_c0_g1~~TRINITY_DN52105_c0_g1_i1.p2  ORF type:complete len:159 (+),score=74.80 TRINITY_DN52105_c0_g1_i1:135-611(+)
MAKEEAKASPAKKAKTSNGGSAAAASGSKATLAELQKKKKEAVKNEDYAEALRLKAEIDKVTAEAAKVKEEKPAAGSGEKKRPAPKKDEDKPAPAKKVKAKKPEPRLKPHAVTELATEPFFDDARAERLLPNCATACEREAFRAVQTKNSCNVQQSRA